jgi:prepilin peptidase CpaA
MTSQMAAAQIVLVITAALLLYVAVNDLRHFKIRNELVLVLAVLFVIHALVSGRWTEMHWNIAIAALAFVFMLFFAYNQGLMGGGDLKLLTVAVLWTGTSCALPFVIFIAIAASVHTVAAKLDWVQSQRVNGRIRVAFAPSISAALIGVFMLGCLAPHQPDVREGVGMGTRHTIRCALQLKLPPC